MCDLQRSCSLFLRTQVGYPESPRVYGFPNCALHVRCNAYLQPTGGSSSLQHLGLSA